jgi:hypothetical protein
MKFNKWTMGLAAVGVVSLASAARADETKMDRVNTAISNTTLSGYVDTSAMWQLGSQHGNPYNQQTGTYLPEPQYTPGYVHGDGFNLDAVDITLDKPMDESPWASGYHVELMTGPDSVGDGYVRQAYLALRTPIGNSGIDWKVGVFDTIIGYESSSDPLNPNFTRSYGWALEPTTHTGILGTYKVNDMFSISAGVANSNRGNASNGSTTPGSGPYETQKAYMGSFTFTAPDGAGFMKGATLSLGAINADNGSSAYSGYNGYFRGYTSLYAGVTVPTPITALKLGAAFDFVDQHNQSGGYGGMGDSSVWNVGLYANWQINDKASFNLRGEYLNDNGSGPYYGSVTGSYYPYNYVQNNNAEELTATLQYNLWANVISRVEFRWDHVEHGKAFDNTTQSNYYGEYATAHDNAFLLAVNLIYQF